MSAVTDRMDPSDIRAIARLLAVVRLRRAAPEPRDADDRAQGTDDAA